MRSKKNAGEQKKDSSKKISKRNCSIGLCEGPCPARLLKECPHCHSVLKSTCSKMACRIDDKKPTMILSASAGSSSGQLRRKEKVLESDDSESEMSAEESEFESELSDIEPSAYYIDEKDVQVTSPQRKAIKVL